jgi:hypothetical protein
MRSGKDSRDPTKDADQTASPRWAVCAQGHAYVPNGGSRLGIRLGVVAAPFNNVSEPLCEVGVDEARLVSVWDTIRIDLTHTFEDRKARIANGGMSSVLGPTPTLFR